MNEIINPNSELNNKKAIKYFYSAVIFSIVILIILAVVEIVSNNLNLNNPLIDENLKSELNAPHFKTVFTYVVGLILVLILKVFKQNILAVFIGVLTICTYFLPDFT